MLSHTEIDRAKEKFRARMAERPDASAVIALHVMSGIVDDALYDWIGRGADGCLLPENQAAHKQVAKLAIELLQEYFP